MHMQKDALVINTVNNEKNNKSNKFLENKSKRDKDNKFKGKKWKQWKDLTYIEKKCLGEKERIRDEIKQVFLFLYNKIRSLGIIQRF